mgnify:CR=1 FL=1
MSFQLDKLANGLQVLRLPVERVESVSVIALVRTGSRYESESEFGVAHFLEHMVFKGTKKYPSTKVISQTLDGIGAMYNAFTSEESTAFFIQAASDKLDLAMDMVGQMVTQALISSEEIKRERGVILEEIHMYRDQPDAHNANIFNRMFYAGCGLAHDILGTPESVAKISRKNFQKYLDTWYGPDNMVLVLAGKAAVIKQPDILAKATAAFNFPKSRAAHPHQRQFWVQNFSYGRRLHLEQRDTQQMHYVLGWPGINRFDQRDEVLALLSVIVGGNMSSRLFTQVRERRGLCYYVNSFADMYSDVGCFGASAGVNPQKLLEALKVTLAEFDHLFGGKNAITAAELARAKDYLRGHLILAEESVQAHAISCGMRYLHEGKIVTVQDRLRAIKMVTLEQVLDLAKQLIVKDKLRLSAIGNFTTRQRQEIQQLLAVNEQDIF